MSDECAIIQAGTLDKYANRPDDLEDVCPADFVCWYEKGRKSSADSDLDSDGELAAESEPDYDQHDEDTDGLDEEEDAHEHYQPDPLPSAVEGWRKRNKCKILRSRGYNRNKDPENFCREKLMLFQPWREESDLLRGYDSYAAAFDADRHAVMSRAQRYDAWNDLLHEIVEQAEEAHMSDSGPQWG